MDEKDARPLARAGGRLPVIASLLRVRLRRRRLGIFHR